MTDKRAVETAIIHSDYVAPEGFSAFPLAVHRASTVVFENVAAMRSRTWQEKSGYTYGLHGTPTSFTLEAKLAEIEGGSHCMLAPSGLAAISMIDMALLRSGDDMLIPDNAYNPNRDLGQWLGRDFGISVRFYDPMVGSGIKDLIRPETRLIWTEAPGSVTMEVPDIPAICAAARSMGPEGQRPWVALDNTWSAGLAFHPFDHGVDISMQALTKYQSGGSDVLMGAVITRNAELVRKIETAHMRLGVGVSMDDCYLVSRGLPSMPLRFKAHDAGARKVAEWLKARPEIAHVLHPALEDCPGHAIWKRDFSGAGGLFSVVFNERFAEAQTDRFVDSLRLFKIGYSWGGAHSLCVPYRVKTMRANWAHQGNLVRFYIGLEDPADLIRDIELALARLDAPT